MVAKKPSTLDNLIQLVNRGYCVGCGICAAMCPENSLKMSWNKWGSYEPVRVGETCSDCLLCAQVCPFADGVIEGITNLNEDEIGELLYKNSTRENDCNIGFFQNCYAGHAKEFRLDSSSGGIITWVLTHLLNTNQVDHVICVSKKESKDPLFEYKTCSTVGEVISCSKSRYYPMQLSNVIKEVMNKEGKYALVALPCMIKGIRFAQGQNQILKERISFCISLFCGGLKTAHFTEYLAAQIGVPRDAIAEVQYRIKHEGSSSQGYYFGCADPSNPLKTLEFRVKRLRDLWGPGFFKPNVCDYCDDVTGELADLSSGDAWIQPFSSDWRGNNIIITRSSWAEEVIAAGINNQSLSLERISPKEVFQAQKSNFVHRRKGLAYRLYWAKDQPVPKKRVLPKKPTNLIEARIFDLRMRIRAKSQEAWLEQRNTTGTQIFDKYIRGDLTKLRRWQYIDRLFHKILKR